MGWCSGTDIFDVVLESLHKEDIPEQVKIRVLTDLMREMSDHDWDCQTDSRYAYKNNKLFDAAYLAIFPEYITGEYCEDDDEYWTPEYIQVLHGE